MQKSSLENFEKDINNIVEYIHHIDLINYVARANRVSTNDSIKKFIEHSSNFRREKKLFEYKAIVISLYGVLEKYIGLWIKEHIEGLSNLIIDYKDIPLKISESHFHLSVKLISMVSENRFAKYEHLTKEEVLTKLNSCINQPLEYKLNSDAFSPMSGNLKHSKIVDAFKPLDIDLESMLKQNSNFSKFLKSKFGENIANRGAELFYIIDDLVMRRNDIAHGTTIDDITSEFDDYIEFLGHYGKAIFESLVQKEIEYEALYLYDKIEKVIKVFKDNESGIKSILAFEIENYKIKKGDYLIIQTDSIFIKKEIIQLNLDKKFYEELEIKEKTNIAVNINFSITENQTFYIERRG